jgi:hypothetical protein
MNERIELLYGYKGASCTCVVRNEDSRGIVELRNDYNELMYRGYEDQVNRFILDLQNKAFV